VSADEQFDGELLAACSERVAEGYRFALDGVPRSRGAERLLRLCDIVTVDVGSSPPREIAPLLDPLRDYHVRLLGERVPNRTVLDECVAHGFELFQGYRFHRPEACATRDLPIDHLQTFRLMKELQNPSAPDSKIEDGFRRDLALTYKLLRMVNSASAGGSGIHSIGHAIRLLGRNTLYRWLSLLLLSSIAERGVDAEIARASLLRGRLCELIALASGVPKAGGPLFIVGVLSLLDVLLGISMEELATRMELATDVRRALLGREDFYGATLALVEAYEEGCWDEVIARCGEVGVQSHVLRGLYFVSLEWAKEQMRA
jgi:c-di-GMP phosphodiesterase